jgi:PKD repeat protein
VYTVTLTVSGSGGTDTSICTSYITVNYIPVVAGFVGAPTSGERPLTVVFTNTSTGDYTSSSWNFGDGGTSGAQNPTYGYTATGVYTVALQVSGPGGTDPLTYSNYITVTPASVHANFSGTPTSGVAPLVVDFTNLSTGDFTTSSWTFGDGGTSIASSPTYTYTAPGVYTVTLQVSGPGGTHTVTRTNYITAYDFVGAPTSGVNPLTVVFTNTSTGDYTSSLWDFGNSGSSAVDSPTYTYTTAGVYTVTLQASGPGGTHALARTNYITVTPAPVGASFIGAPTSGERPLTVVFTNTSTGDYTSSSWNFGDGGTSGAQNPTYGYTTAGVYTVTLQASGPGGTHALTRSNYITVTPASVVADFTGAPTSAGMPPLAVVFTNTSTGDFDSSLWDFGDGVTSTVFISPTHTYTAAGVYTVTLQVSGPGGTDVLTRANYINVASGAVSTPIDPTMGGTLVYTSPSGSSIIIIVPTGAVTQPTTLIYTPVSTTSVPPGYLFGGLAFTLVASQGGTIVSDFSFLRPVAVTINYTDAEVVGIDESTLALFYWDTVTSSWQDVATTCSPPSSYWRYPSHNKVVVCICHLSQFGFFGIIGDSPAYDGSVYLPLILRNE